VWLKKLFQPHVFIFEIGEKGSVAPPYCGAQISIRFTRRIFTMPKKSARDYAAEVRALKEERDQLADDLEEANSKLEEIDEVLYGADEEDEEDEEDDDE
jgi:hypothetical protein